MQTHLKSTFRIEAGDQEEKKHLEDTLLVDDSDLQEDFLKVLEGSQCKWSQRITSFTPEAHWVAQLPVTEGDEKMEEGWQSNYTLVDCLPLPRLKHMHVQPGTFFSSDLLAPINVSVRGKGTDCSLLSWNLSDLICNTWLELGPGYMNVTKEVIFLFSDFCAYRKKETKKSEQRKEKLKKNKNWERTTGSHWVMQTYLQIKWSHWPKIRSHNSPYVVLHQSTKSGKFIKFVTSSVTKNGSLIFVSCAIGKTADFYDSHGVSLFAVAFFSGRTCAVHTGLPGMYLVSLKTNFDGRNEDQCPKCLHYFLAVSAFVCLCLPQHCLCTWVHTKSSK